ncbi:hypothetical protein [Nonomuraea soli]|uniref:Uncharacterized protein n=1 Tax=Nonomuraea soli TaxID=1032476 RepID=A0A7W0CFP4_9ACTN|nr:hypothetical protein [Nonomuraea soli]MBA2890310.1 hypothetical protein [Nonomuraea soli]
MKTTYKILAYVIAAEVAIQSMLIALGIAGLGKWVSEGNIFEKSVMEGEGDLPFPEVIGLMLHGVNGHIVIPALALILLIVSFFARIPGGAKFAGLVLALVAAQALLGGFSRGGIPWMGAVHGFNALLLFAAALYTGRRVAKTAPAQAPATAAA